MKPLAKFFANSGTPARNDTGASMTQAAVRNDRIDILRGVAIACVLLLHFALAYGLRQGPLSLLPKGLTRAVFNGNYGVTMFFATSGFLITSHSLRRWGSLAGIDVPAFYVLRMSRIMPPLLLALAIIVTLGSLGLPWFSNTDNNQQLPASFFFVAAGSVLTFWHNVLMQSVGYFNYCLNIYWSLSVEEVFYLSLPLVCVGLRRNRWLLVVALLAVVVGPFYRQAHVDNEIFYMYANPACFDAIAMGCLAAWAAHHRSVGVRAATALRAVAALVLAGVYLRGIDGHEVWGFTLVALASATFLFAAAHAPAVSARLAWCTAPLRWLGRHSYELYLFHIIVLGLMRNLIAKEEMGYALHLPWLALFVLLSCLIAAAVARWVSEPASRALRQRFANGSIQS
jgi:peptidoglycan/LPS O-acetylase OafA/YrhL